MNKALVIYDATGRIWSIVYGEEEIPQGIPAMFLDVPDGASLDCINVTDPANPVAVFNYLPESDLGKFQKQMAEVKVQMADVKKQESIMSLAVSFAAESFTDEQALQVPSLYPEWSGDGVTYKMGARVRYLNVLYKVLQEHISQFDWSPVEASSLFAWVFIPEPDEIPEWVQPESANGYMTGDKVIHNDIIYESLIDNNVWEPGASGSESLWIEASEE